MRIIKHILAVAMTVLMMVVLLPFKSDVSAAEQTRSSHNYVIDEVNSENTTFPKEGYYSHVWLFPGDTVTVNVSKNIQASTGTSPNVYYMGLQCTNTDSEISKHMKFTTQTYGTANTNKSNVFIQKIEIIGTQPVYIAISGGGGTSTDKGIAYYSRSFWYQVCDESIPIEYSYYYEGSSTNWKLEELNEDKIYYFNGGNRTSAAAIGTQSVDCGAVTGTADTIKLDIPYAEGCKFDHWEIVSCKNESGESNYSFRQDTTNELTWTLQRSNSTKTQTYGHGEVLKLKAIFYEGPTVTLNANGGNIEGYALKIYPQERGGEYEYTYKKVGETQASVLTLSEMIPVRAGYKFDGWYTDKTYTTKVENLIDISQGAYPWYKGAYTLYAKWTTKQIGSITKAVLNKTSYTYNGSVQKPSIKTVNGSTKLTKDVDYTVTYKDSADEVCENPTNAGTYKVVITGIGKYGGTVTKSFTIAKATNTISAESTATTIYVGKRSAEITASAKEDADITYSLDKTSKKYVSIVDDGEGKATLTAIKAGTAKVTVTSAATDNYKAASKTVKVTVKSPLDISSGKYVTVGKAVWNNGSELNPTVAIKNGKTTYAASNYNVGYEVVDANKQAATDWEPGNYVKITIDASNPDLKVLRGVCTKYVLIAKASQTATASAPSTIYYGEGKEPVQIDVDNIPITDGDTNPTVKYKSSSTKIATVSDDGKITPIKAGKVTITVNIGETTHYAAKTIKLTVNVKAATKLTIKNVKITAAYNDGENVVPKVTVTGFKEGTDYTFDYGNSGITDVGHKIIVTVTAVTESGGCLGTYYATVKVGKGEQSITIDSQPTTVKVKATTPTFTIVGVKDNADVDVTTKTYAKMKDLGEDQNGNSQYAIIGVKKGTATVTVKIAGTDKYNAKTITFKVKVTK